MKINFISKKDLIDKLLDKLNEDGELNKELLELLYSLSQWN